MTFILCVCVCICTYVDEYMQVYMCTAGHLWKSENNLQLTGLSSLLPCKPQSLSASNYPLFFNLKNKMTNRPVFSKETRICKSPVTIF